MSRYGKIETGFWHSPKVRQLSQNGRLMLLYLLSCPHSNAAGCFVLPDGYIVADMGWPSETVLETVSELFTKGLIDRDATTQLLRITGWWGHNTIENANVAKHVCKEIALLPNCEVRQRLIDDLLSRDDFHETVRQTISERLAKPFRNQEPNITQQEPIQGGKPPVRVRSEVKDHPDFAEWYANYPKHEARGAAEKAYRTARKSTDAAVLLEGAKKAKARYAGSEPQFIPLPATWLNQKRWLDEAPQKSAATRAQELYREGII